MNLSPMRSLILSLLFVIGFVSMALGNQFSGARTFIVTTFAPTVLLSAYILVAVFILTKPQR